LRLGKVLTIPISASAKKQIASAQQKKRIAQARHKKQIASRAKRTRVAKHKTKSHSAKWRQVQVASADISGTDRGSRIVRTAMPYRGARYRRGGTSAAGFDCSGFTRYVYRKNGVSLPHSSRAQSRIGSPVGKGHLKKGDLVFFSTYRRGVSHVGIYIGGGKFVHAATYGRGVRTDSLGASYYCSRYRGARRVQ
jgi:cell wall-associated NlpC family hydrolase